MAALVKQEGIDADRAAAGEMVLQDLVGEGEQHPVRALGALDPGFAAEGAIPLVRAGGRVARLCLPCSASAARRRRRDRGRACETEPVWQRQESRRSRGHRWRSHWAGPRLVSGGSGPEAGPAGARTQLARAATSGGRSRRAGGRTRRAEPRPPRSRHRRRSCRHCLSQSHESKASSPKLTYNAVVRSHSPQERRGGTA